MRDHRGFGLDVPLLELLHRHAVPGWDWAALAASHLGLYGTFVIDLALLLVLVRRRKYRGAAFFGANVIGSLLLNVSVKATFARARPALWASLAPETSFSFPSGHAMGSASLALGLVVLAWPTRAKWPVLVLGPLFALAVALSRVYLGVHFPSDIVAAWTASTAWGLGLALVFVPRHAALESADP